MKVQDKIEMLEIFALVPYARNSRTHSSEQIDEIKGSIEAFGMVGSIVVRNGVIAKGHGTTQAIQRIYAEGKLLYPAPGKGQGSTPYPLGMVPVLDVSGWTEAQFRAYVIADNKIGTNSGWDDEILAGELTALLSDKFDTGLLGFDIDAEELIADLLAPSRFEKSQPNNFREPEEDESESANLQKYPLTVILDEKEFSEWDARKEKTGYSDKRLLLELLRGKK